MDKVKKQAELAEKLLSVLTRISFLLGSAIFLIYCLSNGGLPEGLSAGDSLRIFLVVALFSMGTLVVYLGLMTLGMTLCYLLYRLLRLPVFRSVFRGLVALLRRARQKKVAWQHGPSEFRRNYRRPQAFIYNITFPRFPVLMHFTISPLIVLFIGLLVKTDLIFWYVKLGVAALYLGLWFVFVDLNRQRSAQAKIVFRDAVTPVKVKSEIRLVNAVITLFVFLSVTFYLGLFNTTANQTMRLLGMRHDHATVYLTRQWTRILDNHGIYSTPSDIAAYDRKYVNITVGMTGMGTSDNLNFPGTESSFRLRVPHKDVLIDPGR